MVPRQRVMIPTRTRGSSRTCLAPDRDDGRGVHRARSRASSVGTASMWAISGRNGVYLDAPKGIAFQGDTLWTADIDVVRGFNKRTGAPVGVIDFRPFGAVLLNDLAVGPDGTMYVTDTGIEMTDIGVLLSGRRQDLRRVARPAGVGADGREQLAA